MKRLFTLMLAAMVFAVVGCDPFANIDNNMGGGSNTQTFTFEENTDLNPTVKSKSSSITFKFTTSVDWSVATDKDWVKITPNSGTSANNKFVVKVSENTKLKSRKAVLTVTYGETQTIEINITQEGTDSDAEDDGGEDDGSDDGSEDDGEEVVPTSEIWYTTTDDEVIEIDNEAFDIEIVSNEYNDGKGVITFSDEVTVIGEYAFGSENLKTITIPNSVTEIQKYAFCECAELESFTVPKSVEILASGAFISCESLKKFSGKFASSDKRCLIDDGTLLAFASAGLTEYTIPKGVTVIGYYSCNSAKSLEKLIIPNGVEEIKSVAFSCCSSLVDVTIPDSVEYIRDNAFEDCDSLESIVLPKSLKRLGSSAFWHCDNLESVYCPSVTPPTANYKESWGAFDENASGRKIYVPTESVETYREADGWAEYADDIVGYDFGEDEEETPSDPIKLDTPYVWVEDVTSSSFVVCWEAVDNTSKYLVNDGSRSIVVTDTYYEMTNLEAGTYTIKVRAKGDGKIYEDSDWASVTQTIEGEYPDYSEYWAEVVVSLPTAADEVDGHYPFSHIYQFIQGYGVTNVIYGGFLASSVEDYTASELVGSLFAYIDDDGLESVNGSGWLSSWSGLDPETEYRFITQVTYADGSKELFDQTMATEAHPNLLVNQWLGNWTATTDMALVYDGEGYSIAEEVQNFDVRVESAEDYATNGVAIYGMGAVGMRYDIPTYGVIQSDGSLEIDNYVVVDEDDSYRYAYSNYSLGYNDTEGPFLVIVSGDFPAFTVNLDGSTATATPYSSTLADTYNSEYQVLFVDYLVFDLNDEYVGKYHQMFYEKEGANVYIPAGVQTWTRVSQNRAALAPKAIKQTAKKRAQMSLPAPKNNSRANIAIKQSVAR